MLSARISGRWISRQEQGRAYYRQKRENSAQGKYGSQMMEYSPLNRQNEQNDGKTVDIVAEPAVEYAAVVATKQLPKSLVGVTGANTPENATGLMLVEVAKRKEGRMSLFTPERAATVLEGVENGLTMDKIADSIGVHRSTIWTWMQLNQEFSDGVAQAREFQAHAYADDAVKILDGVVIDPENPKVAMAELRKAEQQARIRTNLAECFNFSQYGKKQQNLNLNLNAEVSPVDLSKFGFGGK